MGSRRIWSERSLFSPWLPVTHFRSFFYSLLATRYSLHFSSMSEPKLTPMMQQYFEVKRGLPRDTLLLFRLGDFFELFFDDAVTASKLLGLTLTRRQETPMAGLPAHAIDNY